MRIEALRPSGKDPMEMRCNFEKAWKEIQIDFGILPGPKSPRKAIKWKSDFDFKPHPDANYWAWSGQDKWDR